MNTTSAATITAEEKLGTENESGMSRRHFLSLSAGVSTVVVLGSATQAVAQNQGGQSRNIVNSTFPIASAAVLQGQAPQAPYRIWGGAEFFTRNPEIYSNMTIEATGTVDPRVLAVTGKHGLDVIQGTQTTNARGSYYWKNPTSLQWRSRAAFKTLPSLASAGLSVQNWGGPLPLNKPDNEKWMLEGLREGKTANPKCFITAWVSQPNEAMFSAGRDGLVDLFIVEGFTHRTPEQSAASIVSWEQALDRCEGFKRAGLLSKTILAFGYIDRDALLNNDKLSKEWLGVKMKEIKQRYPEMPGVAFLQTSTTRGDGTIDVIRHCNALSAELWPSA